ncbi:MAG: hypothetical protein A3E87_08740 [Gammaproteobacteria bacterium RIFCSPHIGHO2_12_FULL_35_23]|nr:MAG: hypothetical protein A3E87_08740 [Gammaproteobacteria bacterium RIFCSPHIGHO2_12_FULL_35_23]
MSFCWLMISINCLAQSSASQTAYLLNLQGEIGPATQIYVEHGLEIAAANKAAVVILELNTPGGLLKSTRNIVQAILASPIPVITYIAPAGAQAASAGTFIVYASQIAAMAPGTNLGAASPIDLFNSSQQTKKQSIAMNKVQQDTVAFIRSLAELNNRNPEWAEKAVTQAASLTATQALKQQVINFVAPDVTNLLAQANGKIVKVKDQWQTLNTKNLTLKKFAPNLRENILGIVASPSVAYILLLIGIYGIFFELMNPGMIVPGVIGLIALLVAVYGISLLPINYVGISLLIAGLLMMILELFVTSYGILAVGGIIAFFLGSLFMFDRHVPGYEVALSIALGITIVTAIFFLFILRLAVKSQQRPIVSGGEELIGASGVVVEVDKTQLMVRVHGELWQAVCESSLPVGKKIIVKDRNGLLLNVAPEKN